VRKFLSDNISLFFYSCESNKRLICRNFIKKKYLIFIISTFLINYIPIDLIAQQYNIWYFGEGRFMDFNDNEVKIYKSPKFDINTLGGGSNFAIYCDSLGKLQSFTTFWGIINKDFEIIENSDKLLLYINSLYKHRSIILPSKQNGIFYYFSNANHDGFNYAKFDMNANGGKGKVIQNTTLVDSGRFSYFCPIRDSISSNYWFVSLNILDSMFYSWYYDGNTVVLKNKSNYPSPYRSLNDNYEAFRGVITISNNGRFIFEAVPTRDSIFLKIYKFTRSDGKISLVRKIFISKIIDLNGKAMRPFSLSISPNDSLVYCGIVYQTKDTNYKNSIYQINYLIDTPEIFYIPVKFDPRDMQLAPDGKIYILSEGDRTYMNGYISVISNPNLINERCNFNENKYFLDTNSFGCYFPISFYQNMKISFENRNECYRKHQFNNKSDSNIFKDFTWYFPNGDSISGFNANYEFPKSGKHLVKLKAVTPAGYTRWGYDTIEYLKPPIANFTTDTTIGCQWLKFKFFDASVKDTVHPTLGESWLWHFGDGTTDTVKNPEHIYTKTGKYKVKLIYSNGFCTDTIEKEQAVEIIEAPRPGFKMSQTNYCSPYFLQITDT